MSKPLSYMTSNSRQHTCVKKSDGENWVSYTQDNSWPTPAAIIISLTAIESAIRTGKKGLKCIL